MEVSNIIRAMFDLLPKALNMITPWKILADAGEGCAESMSLLQQQAFEIGTDLCSGIGVWTLAQAHLGKFPWLGMQGSAG